VSRLFPKTIFLCHEDWQSLPIIPTEIAQIGYSQTGQTSTAQKMGGVPMKVGNVGNTSMTS
jgi:hypothetical protein